MQLVVSHILCDNNNNPAGLFVTYINFKNLFTDSQKMFGNVVDGFSAC